MKEYLIIGLAIVTVLLVFIIVLKLCSRFRNKVYQLFIKAENEAQKGEKMDYVVQQIYFNLPTPISMFINEDFLRWIIQKMFDVIADFLDDGKINRRKEK